MRRQLGSNLIDEESTLTAAADLLVANWPLNLDSDKRVKNGLDSLHAMGAAAVDVLLPMEIYS